MTFVALKFFFGHDVKISVCVSVCSVRHKLMILEDDIKMKMTSKIQTEMKVNPKMKTTQKRKTTSEIKTTLKMKMTHKMKTT